MSDPFSDHIFNYEIPEYWESDPTNPNAKRSDYVRMPFFDWGINGADFIKKISTQTLWNNTYKIAYFGAGLSEIPFIVPNQMLCIDISKSTVDLMN